MLLKLSKEEGCVIKEERNQSTSEEEVFQNQLLYEDQNYALFSLFIRFPFWKHFARFAEQQLLIEHIIP